MSTEKHDGKSGQWQPRTSDDLNSPNGRLHEARRLLSETQDRISVILHMVGCAPPFGTEEELLISRVALDASNEINEYLIHVGWFDRGAASDDCATAEVSQ